MPQSPRISQWTGGTTLFKAQQSALETASRLNSAALNCAIDLHKTWFELLQRHMMHYASLPQRLVECRTPQEVFSVQADVVGKTTEEIKEGLSAQAGAIGRASQDYKEGLDQLASIGEEMANRAGQVVEQGAKAARAMTKQAGQAMEQRPQAAQKAARGETKSSRAEGESRGQAHRH